MKRTTKGGALFAYLSSRKKIVDDALSGFLPRKTPFRLYDAMRYSVFSGGKRIRPIVVIAGAEICGGETADVIESACAVELIHTYSLIHDDLPAIDNDDFRRGKPTCHKKFSEDIALLAGDALLTYAFELLGKNISRVRARLSAEIVKEVSMAVGKDGMVGGQVLDLECSGIKNFNGRRVKRLLDEIHINKTAKLIELSSKLGAMVLGAQENQIKALESYGRNIGLAFQIADDLLDFKEEASDIRNKRLTYPLIYGVESSSEMAKDCVLKAKASLKRFKGGEVLCDLADFIVERTY